MIKVSILGDLMCLPEQNEAILKKYGRFYYDDVFFNASCLFDKSDIVIGILETPVCNKEYSDGMISFNTPKEFVESAKRLLKLSIVSTANNHCLDRGIEGLEETIVSLNEIGLLHTGTYLSKEESEAISNIKIKGISFSLIAPTYGTNSKVNGNMLPECDTWKIDLLKKQEKKSKLQWKPEYGPLISEYIPDNVSPLAIGNAMHQKYLDRIVNKITMAKEVSDYVICMPHVGGQYNPYPAGYAKYIYELLSRGDADFIIGGHPHVPQKNEFINNKFIAYSMGNFTFTPGVGYFLPNTLSEYGIVYHLYFNEVSKALERITLSLIINVVKEDGIAYVYPFEDYFESCKDIIIKDKLKMEYDAVLDRVISSSRLKFGREYIIFN